MSWNVLQSATGTGTDEASSAATFGSNVSSGTKIIVACSSSGTQTVASVQDAALNNWTEIGSAGAGGGYVWLYALDTPAGDVGTKPTITVTYGSTAHDKSMVIMEVSGLLPGNTTAMVDGTAEGLTGTAASTGSPAYSSTVSGEYLVAAYGDFGSGQTVVKAAGWTGMAGVNDNSGSDCLIEYKNSTGGSEANGFTTADPGGWAIVMVAFKLPPVTPWHGPVRARIPQNRARGIYMRGAPKGTSFGTGQVQWNAGGPVRNPPYYIVQHASNTASFTSGTTNSATVTFGQNITPGNTVVLFTGVNMGSGTISASSVTTNGSADNWSFPDYASFYGNIGISGLALDFNSAGGAAAIDYSITQSVAATTSETTSVLLDAFEVAGLGPNPAVDSYTSDNAGGASTTTWTSGSYPGDPAGANNGIFLGSVCLYVNASNTTSAVTGPGGWTNEPALSGSIQQGGTGTANKFFVYQISGYEGPFSSSPPVLVYSGTNSAAADAYGAWGISLYNGISPSWWGGPIAALLPHPPAGPGSIRGGRVASNKGAPVSNPVPPSIGPVFHQATSPIRARIPRGAPSGGITGTGSGGAVCGAINGNGFGNGNGSKGAPLRNPTPGPVFRQRTTPVRFILPPPHPRAGRIGSSFGAPVENPVHGPPVYPLRSPVRVRLPELQPRAGRISSNAGVLPQGWSVVQSASAGTPYGSPVTAVSVTYGSNLASGNVLLAYVSFFANNNPAATIASVEDGSGNFFTQIANENLAGSASVGSVSLWALATPSGDAGTEPTITATINSPGANGAAILVQEVSGIPVTPDGIPGVAESYGAGSISPSYSSTAANEFLVAVFGDDGGPETATQSGSGYTTDANSINDNGNADIVVAYRNSTGGAESDGWSLSGTLTAQGAILVAFGITAPSEPHFQVVQPVQARIPRVPSKGRAGFNAGAPVHNPVQGAPFPPAQGPVQARFPQLHPRAGRIASSPGAPLRNPVPGPVFHSAVQALRAHLPQQPFLKGRVSSNTGAPVHNPAPGPAFYPAAQPIRARIPQAFSKGRASSNAGAPVRNPTPGPVFYQAVTPTRIRPALPPRGRVASNSGIPFVPSVTGPPFYPLRSPVRARIPQNAPRGRILSSTGAPVRNPTRGPVFRQAVSPVRVSMPKAFSKGRAGSNAGAPVRNLTSGPVFRQAAHPAQAKPPGKQYHRGLLYSSRSFSWPSFPHHTSYSVGAISANYGITYAFDFTLTGQEYSRPLTSGYILQADEWNSSEAYTVAGNNAGTAFYVETSEIDNAYPGDPGAYASFVSGNSSGVVSCGPGMPAQVSAIISRAIPATTSFATITSGAVSDSVYDVIYDIWFNAQGVGVTDNNTNGLEVEIVLDLQGVNPAGSLVASNVSLGSVTCDVYYDTGSADYGLVSYVITPSVSSVTDLDLQPFTADLVTRGYIPSTSWYLINVQAGFEIWQGGTGLWCTGFSTSIESPPAPKVTALSDAFPGNSLNATLWTASLSGAGGAVVVNNGLSLTDTADSSTSTSIASNALYDLTDSEIYVQLVNAGTQAADTLSIFQVYQGTNSILQILVNDGFLNAQEIINDSANNLASVTYNSTARQWLRFRESSGTVYFEYAAAAAGPWTTLYSYADPFCLNALQVGISQGSYGSSDPQTTSQWANLNTGAGIGPVFYPADSPIRARIPQAFSKGRTSANHGAPVRNPVAGPAFRQAASPSRIHPSLPPRGRNASNPGGPVSNPPPPIPGPPFRPSGAVRARYLNQVYVLGNPGLIYVNSRDGTP